ncbi:dynein light intermediate chain-domain-containing protein [Staphylotrichum tortipilum]|uniref:Dynein light intermediate chain-domain-containing protein n=1 Tax=Staphylotrichum tortipilum TaxID=2831512 RepID=A0AAN6MP94_9PEZI|nr:dynein light intermediate chain-domain-containing protein [Staphylotrichum longicolle]
MAANTNRYSAYTAASAASAADSKNGDADKKDLWSSMLSSVASGRRLPEKNIILLGGTVDSQREFFETLSNNDLRRALDRNSSTSRAPPVANSFALGYAYYDVLDADQEDTLARISLYTLTNPSPAFASLLHPLLTPRSIPNTLIVVLLDWSQPWKWMRQLREWILLLRTVLISLSDGSKETMEEVMLAWRDRGRGGGTNLDGSTAVPVGDSEVDIPVGPGEWEDALGLPLCVVCQNAEKMEYLEKTQSWKEEEFDVVLQFMRTVLLRHGASLIYTTPSVPSPLPTLVHSSLGIHSLLKKQPLKHNVIDRDKVVIPPNWDSWGKIRVLRDGFDVDQVSTGWSIDLDQPFGGPANGQHANANGHSTNGDAAAARPDPSDPEGSTVALYEDSVQDPSMDALQLAGRNTHSTVLEVETIDTQTFLGQQLKVLDAFKQKSAEEAAREDSRHRIGHGSGNRGRVEDEHLVGGGDEVAEARVLEHIGPVQFNMGGIQVDADDMVQRLKERQAYGSSPEPGSPTGEEVMESTPHMDPEDLQAFFQGLMNKRGPAAK